jgi:site-specific recombinase XerD
MSASTEEFCRYVSKFLHVYLPYQRNLSPNTIRSYRNALNQFVDYLLEQCGYRYHDIGFAIFKRDVFVGFISWLNSDRGCSGRTCNQRLAALSSFFRFVALEDVALSVPSFEIARVPTMKHELKPVEYLSAEAVTMLLDQPDRTTKKGQRDAMLIIMLYDTAARITELLTLETKDIRTDLNTPYATLKGKGGKRRSVPLMQRTLNHLETYMNTFHPKHDDPSPYLFYTVIKGRAGAMSYENASKMIAKYGRLAASASKEVPGKIHAHLLRHTRSIHLYQDGVPLSYIKDFLGHSNINTTSIYASADLGMLRSMLEGVSDPLESFTPMINWKNEKEKLKTLAGLS